MAPGLFDHLILATLVVVIPFEGLKGRRRLERRIAEGGGDARRREYLKTIAWQWAFAIGVVSIWVVQSRPWSALGISASFGWGFWIAAVFAAALTVLLARQARFARTRPDFAARVRTIGKSIEFLLPTTPPELRIFDVLGLTAGIVEELLCRGFLIWYFASYIPFGPAIVASAIVFGMGHLYQGLRGVLKTGAVGLALSGVYVLAGSLWIPMFIHAAADILQVRMMYNARTCHDSDMILAT